MLTQLLVAILAKLLHHANREGRNEYFYRIKNRVLARYGKHIGYDVQFIAGKQCNSCKGTGIHVGYDWHNDETDYETCYRCYNGWYKRPVWNILERVRLGKYVFHQPYQRAYSKPELSVPVIEGYIEHRKSNYGGLCLFVLFLLYEKGYMKRWYQYQGTGWRCMWWHPRNWVYNLIHLIKKKERAIPIQNIFTHWEQHKKSRIIKTHPEDYLPEDDLPF